MKRIYIICMLAGLALFTSCHKPGIIQVKNDISGVKITEVKWGNYNLSSELLPGQSSQKVTMRWIFEKLPATNKISFIMRANSQYVYLETTEEFTLNEEDELLIILNDETKVSN